MNALINILLSCALYTIMHMMGDKNAFMTSIVALNIMMLRDDIVKAIKEKP